MTLDEIRVTAVHRPHEIGNGQAQDRMQLSR